MKNFYPQTSSCRCWRNARSVRFPQNYFFLKKKTPHQCDGHGPLSSPIRLSVSAHKPRTRKLYLRGGQQQVRRPQQETECGSHLPLNQISLRTRKRRCRVGAARSLLAPQDPQPSPRGENAGKGGWVSELLGARRFIKEKNAAGEAEKLRASLVTARRVLLEHQARHISSGASGAIPRDRSDTHCTCPLPSNGASNLSQTLFDMSVNLHTL